jgi:hypothetical protein
MASGKPSDKAMQKASTNTICHDRARLETQKWNKLLYTPYGKWEALRQNHAKGINKHHLP